LSHSIELYSRRTEKPLNLDDEAKELVKELGAAINRAIERSAEVAQAIENLREAGYETELSLRLQIGMRHLGATDEEDSETDHQTDEAEFETTATLELTEEDRRTLRRMKIRVDDFD
jgi:hypothetical protein